jgi:hypothetical protein
MDVDNDKSIRNPNGSLYMIIQKGVTITYVPSDRKRLFFLDIPLRQIENISVREVTLPDVQRNNHRATQLVLDLKSSDEPGKCLINAKEEQLNIITLTFSSAKEAKQAMATLQCHLVIARQLRFWNSASYNVSSDRNQLQPTSSQRIDSQRQIEQPCQTNAIKKLKASIKLNAPKKQQQGLELTLQPGASTPERVVPVKDALRYNPPRFETVEHHNSPREFGANQKKLLAPAIKARKPATTTNGMKGTKAALVTRVKPITSGHRNKDIYEIPFSEGEEHSASYDEQQYHSTKGKMKKKNASAKATRKTKLAVKTVAGANVLSITCRAKERALRNRVICEDDSAEELNIHPSRVAETSPEPRKSFLQAKVSHKKHKAVPLAEQQDVDVVSMDQPVCTWTVVPIEDNNISGKTTALLEEHIVGGVKISPSRASVSSPNEDAINAALGTPIPRLKAILKASNGLKVFPNEIDRERAVPRRLTERSFQDFQVKELAKKPAVELVKSNIIRHEKPLGGLAQSSNQAWQSARPVHQSSQAVPESIKNRDDVISIAETFVLLPKITDVQNPVMRMKTGAEELPRHQAKRVSSQSPPASSPGRFVSMLNALNGTIDNHQEDNALEASLPTCSIVLPKTNREAASIGSTDGFFVDGNELTGEQLVATTEFVAPVFTKKSCPPVHIKSVSYPLKTLNDRAEKVSQRQSFQFSHRSVRITHDGSPMPNDTRGDAEQQSPSSTHSVAIVRRFNRHQLPETSNVDRKERTWSSNSKLLPKSPQAQSQAISGYAIGNSVEKFVARPKHQNVINPFEDSNLAGQVGERSAFARKLAQVTAETPSNAHRISPGSILLSDETRNEMTSDSSSAEIHETSQPSKGYYDLSGEREWEAALLPRHRTILDVLGRISRRLISHLVNSETAVDDIINYYVDDGEVLVEKLEVSRQEQCEDFLRTFETLRLKLMTEYKTSAGKLDDQQRSANEGKKQLKNLKKIQEMTVLNVEKLEAMAKIHRELPGC